MVRLVARRARRPMRSAERRRRTEASCRSKDAVTRAKVQKRWGGNECVRRPERVRWIVECLRKESFGRPVGKLSSTRLYHICVMAFPIRTCVVCSEEFELKPGKPGFANRCPACSEPEPVEPKTKQSMDADERKALTEANEARRRAMRDLL